MEGKYYDVPLNDMSTFKDLYVSVGIPTTGKTLEYGGVSLKLTDLVTDEIICELRTNTSKHLTLVNEPPKTPAPKELAIVDESSAVKTVLSKYQETARTAILHDLCTDLLKVIDLANGHRLERLARLEHRTGRGDLFMNTTFIFLNGPSMMGKTLSTIALDFFAEHPFTPLSASDCPTNIKAMIRLVMSDPYDKGKSSLPQDTYEAGDQFSKEWLAAAKIDLKKLGRSSEIDGSTLCWKKHGFYTVGYIVSLIESRINTAVTSLMTYEPMTVAEGRARISQWTGKYPIVASLDEFNTSKYKTKFNRLLFFSRNILREIGCIVIIVGTNARAVTPSKNTNSGHSRQKEEPPWCYLVSRLPGLSRNAYPLDLSIYSDRFKSIEEYMMFVNWILHTDANGLYTVCENAGFLEAFFEDLVNFLETSKDRLTVSELLSKVFASVAMKIYTKKTRFLGLVDLYSIYPNSASNIRCIRIKKALLLPQCFPAFLDQQVSRKIFVTLP